MRLPRVRQPAPVQTPRVSPDPLSPDPLARQSLATRASPTPTTASTADPDRVQSQGPRRPACARASPRQALASHPEKSPRLPCAGRPPHNCAWEDHVRMKLLFFDDFRLGVLKGEQVVDVSDAVKDIPALEPHHVIKGVIERWAEYRAKLEQAAASGQGRPVANVRIRPPLPNPSNIVCMAVNYMENGTRSEPAPINAFQKSPSAIVGPGDTMVLPDVPATIFEGEAEIALVMARHTSEVAADKAMDYIFGYVNFIDGSARGLAPGGFYTMKSRDTFAPIGPFLVTRDE